MEEEVGTMKAEVGRNRLNSAHGLQNGGGREFSGMPKIPLSRLGACLCALGLFALAGCSYGTADSKTMASSQEHIPSRPDRIVLTEAEWRARLTPEQFQVLRRGGTERPFCEAYLESRNHGKGSYHCAGCDLELFVSDAKFNSGTGWPSFFQPAGKDRIDERMDTSYGMVRTEILCARCGGHLGHVFEDGPRPTGLRYCVNGSALVFKPAKE
jgi:peptide-methionine (R)-S-oxide reductase